MPEKTRRPDVRHVLKELAFATALGCGLVQGRDALRRLRRQCRGVILTYHRIGEPDRMTRSADAFQADLAYLRERFVCVTLSELVARMDGDEPWARPLAAITFDDGYRDNYTRAVPLLRAAGVPATFFVSTGFVGADLDFPHDLGDGECAGPAPRFAKLTWEDLREMQADGFEIGSHTVGHVDLGACDALRVRTELVESLACLNEQLGSRPRALAYPWGRRRNLPANPSQAVRDAGYYAAVTTSVGDIVPGLDRYVLPRIDVGNGAISRRGFRARVSRLPRVGASDGSR